MVQHVERAILDTYEKLALSQGQATGGNRGVSEDMRIHATPIVPQPALDQYAGKYERPPITSYELRVEGGALRAGGATGSRHVFYGPDVAYVASIDETSGGYVGMPIEFIRNAAGAVGWIRVNGRIARKMQ